MIYLLIKTKKIHVITSFAFLSKINTLFPFLTFFEANPHRFSTSAWAWHHCNFQPISKYATAIQQAKSSIVGLDSSHLKGVRVFGTGPSLQMAIKADHSGYFNIVCNTIVKDPILWHAINPKILCAADALYHFDESLHAIQFRKDAKKRLYESQNTLFAYPLLFHEYVSASFKDFKNQLLPIPQGALKTIHHNLKLNFELPLLGNSLLLMLLPLACSFSKKIHFWGFDGRAPNDSLFWSNSPAHSYPELIANLKETHPAFFQAHVPTDNPFKYFKNVHGDVLEMALLEAESHGHVFTSDTPSYTPSIQKRLTQT